MIPARWPSSANWMYCATSCGAGTEVYHSSHNRPLDAAAASPASCDGASGSSLTPLPSSVIGATWITARDDAGSGAARCEAATAVRARRFESPADRGASARREYRLLSEPLELSG